MNISISTYEIKYGDTLDSVAEQFGISAEELKRYHNTYSDLKNLIEYNLNGLSEIFIPPRERIIEIQKNQKELSLASGLPSLYLTAGFYASNYKVTERIEQIDKEDIEINYSTSVSLQETKDKGFVAEIQTSGFKKHGQTPDDKISMLSLACTESISPIKFSVPAQGKINGFDDHKELIKKFENKRPDLESFFTGEISTVHFNQFYENLIDENYLLKQFSSALLYQVLFPKMDWFHRKTEWKENFYVIPNSFPVKCLFHCEYNFENPETVETIIKGKIAEECSLQELLKGVKFDESPEDKLKGDLELHYTTNKETKQLKNVEASIMLFHNEEFYRKYNLKLIAKENIKQKFNTLID
ncbi:LysM peptidoglycan-binding domain-containing protein [Epilithonimonas sp. UC225_85]|uniref:LysM peptidoglycan-binding domain-containing protein n=1 Tax=Epilithonimonas sp. UC225_85 TaxID=3350167 RepID=UPI0036D2DA8B